MTDFVDIPQPSPTETGIQNLTLDQQLGLLMKDVNLTRNPTSHVHKNDEGYGFLLREISENAVTTDRTRVGLVVGNGAILSSLPDIPADTVIISDYNPFIHEWTQFTANALNQANSPDEYRKFVYSDQNPLYQELQAQRLRPEDGLTYEMIDLGEKHFLSSQARFTVCKQALQKKHLLNLAVNLTDRPSLEHFAKILKQGKAEITFSNLTNVWEHAGDSLESSLPVLPFNPEAIIMHSSRAYTDRGNPKMMKISKGLSAYVDAAKPASSFWKNYGKYPRNRRGS